MAIPAMDCEYDDSSDSDDKAAPQQSGYSFYTPLTEARKVPLVVKTLHRECEKHIRRNKADNGGCDQQTTIVTVESVILWPRPHKEFRAYSSDGQRKFLSI